MPTTQNPDDDLLTGATYAEADKFLSYAFRLSNELPETIGFGVEPDRAVGFIRRFMRNRGLTLERATTTGPEPVETETNRTKDSTMTTETSDIRVGRNLHEDFTTVLSDAALLSVGHDLTLNERQRAAALRYKGIGLQELARVSLEHDRSGNVPLTADALFAAAISTGTFTNVLAETTGRALAKGYQSYEGSFQQWAGERAVSNLKEHSDIQLSEFGAMELIPDGGEIPHDTLVDSKETYTAETYGKQFNLTRKTWINDDLGAFMDIPRKMGRAAARNIDAIGYALLISNAGVGPTMNEDSTALFDTGRTTPNYKTGDPDSVLSDTGLANAKTLMRKIKHGDVDIQVNPRFLLVPPELEHTALKLIESQEIMVAGTAGSNVYLPTANVHRGTLILIVEPRLSAGTNGTTAWYLIADAQDVP